MDCAPFVIGIHYAKRWPSISHAFGLYRGEMLEGVCTFGTPASAPLRSGIAGPDYAKNILELNRLCLRTNAPNDASRLVGGSLKLLRQRGQFIVISFADTDQSHVGTVYQAANFSYHGLSEKRTDWKVRGMEHLHGQTIADEFRGMDNRASMMRQKYGDDFYLAARPLKHRYISIVGGHKFKREASLALRYVRLPYPKPVTND
jgi:hypothetical protein